MAMTMVCALAGAGLLAGHGWAEGPGRPLDLGPTIVVHPKEGPLPSATARRKATPSPMSPSLPSPSRVRTVPASPSATVSASSAGRPPTKSAKPVNPASRQSGGRPVRTLPPPHSSDRIPVPEIDEEEDEEENADGGGGGSGEISGDDGDDGDEDDES